MPGSPSKTPRCGEESLTALQRQQPSRGTVSGTPSSATPKLTPSNRQCTPSLPPSLAVTQEIPANSTSASADRKGSQADAGREEAEEEEFIRHAVLRFTATAAVTRRRGRPRCPSSTEAAAPREAGHVNAREPVSNGCRSSLLIEKFCPARSRKKRKTHALDPFLSSTSGIPLPSPPHAAASALAASLSNLGRVAPTTQPLATPEPPSDTNAVTHTPSVKPVQAPCRFVRRRKEESPRQRLTKDRLAADIARVKKTKTTASTQLSPSPGARKRRLPARRRRVLHSAKSTEGNKARAFEREYSRAPEPPLSMTFSDVSLLRQMPDSDAADVCVRFFLDDDDDARGCNGAAESVNAGVAAPFAFLRDVVVQLGGAISGDGNSSSGSKGGEAQWFGRTLTTTTAAAAAATAASARHQNGDGAASDVPPRKTTHLVVSLRAVLTPEILFFKALGIPIVTPQWVYDSIALGGFPVVVPHLHAHPVFGDVDPVDADHADAKPSVGAAADEVQDVDSAVADLLGGDDGAVRSPKQAVQVSPGGRASTLRELHKEVADEYVPAGEQAKRPYYRPIFQDCMFYLYVPPIDLASLHTPAKRARQASTAATGSYLGDVAAALVQATQLLRLLGGTVTRNLASTFLDVVVDLTGFYERTIEAGQQQQQQRQLQRMLRESLSCAYHDALQRLSQMPAARVDVEPTKRSGNAPPVVGISWLLYSILQRQRAAVAPFIQPAHPLSAQLAALHNGKRLEKTTAGRRKRKTADGEKDKTAVVDHLSDEARNVVATSMPTPIFSDISSFPSSVDFQLSLSSPAPSASASATTRHARQPPHAGAYVIVSLVRTGGPRVNEGLL
ncbi:hypothetical protein NQL31_006150 [Lotmaria passim]